MKKYILIAAITFALVVFHNNLFAQETSQPDSILKPINDLSWFPKGTAFASFNGETYMIVWTYEKFNGDYRWYPYVYKASNGNFVPFTVNNSNKLEFHYKHEEDVGYCIWTRMNVEIWGNAFAFTYAGQLWYYCLIKHPPYPGYFPGTYYELWARFENTATGWTTWYNEIQDKPTKWKLGACVVDTSLRIVSWDDVAEKLVTEDFIYNSNTRKLDFKATVPVSLQGEWVGGLISYKDAANQNCMIYNTYSEGNEGYVTCVSPTFATYNNTITSCGASKMVMGSAQGMDVTETHNPEEGTRFNVFYLPNYKNGSGGYDLYNYEYMLATNPNLQPYRAENRVVNLPSTNTPQKCGGYYELGISNVMIPGEYTKEVGGLDGLQMQLQLFYSDNSNELFGAFFNSDIWRPVPGSSVSSIDLDDDRLYGPEIRKLWTLVGITDGAPPCSIDWARWEATHNAITEPTELKFSTEAEQSGEVTSTFEDAYSVGGKISVGIEKIIKMDMSFSYANAYKSLVSSDTTITSTLTTPIGLNEESQDLGFYIWNIPQITRTSYMVYPWWSMEWPVVNSLQYQFRTINAFLTKENVEISEFPFLIDEPNNPNLVDFTQSARQNMMNSATVNGLAPLKTITWVDPTNGQSFSFSEVNAETSSVETSNTYKWEEGSSFAIPGIFKIDLNSDQEVSYTSEYKYETKFGQEVEVTLGNLIKQTDGPNFHKYTVSTYWFKPNVANWWYLDSMEGQKPWYIAYIISGLQTKLQLLSPAPASNLRGSDLLFSWQAVDGELFDYELFISTDPTAGPGSTIYRLACGDRVVANPEDFKPEPGKTYYWTVKGTASTGETVWSGSRIFTVGVKQPGETPSLLKAAIYPNPGRIADIRIAIDPESDGMIMVRLININGAVVATREIVDEDGLPVTVSFTGLNLPTGIYFAVITKGEEQVVKKVVVR